MTSRLGIRLGIAAAMLCAATPMQASAGGGITTAHPLTVSLKSISQMTTNAGDLKPDPFNANVNDLFSACVPGNPRPTRTQGVYLFLNCASLDLTPLEIDAIDTNPVGLIAPIGTVSFDTDFLVETEVKGTLKSVIVPATVNINCNGGAVVATLQGVMRLNYSKVGQTTNICPDSGQMKLTGTASGGALPDSILDSGTVINIKKRSASINSVPPPAP